LLPAARIVPESGRPPSITNDCMAFSVASVDVIASGVS
jgi:hypothetical protein